MKELVSAFKPQGHDWCHLRREQQRPSNAKVTLWLRQKSLWACFFCKSGQSSGKEDKSPVSSDVTSVQPQPVHNSTSLREGEVDKGQRDFRPLSLLHRSCSWARAELPASTWAFKSRKMHLYQELRLAVISWHCYPSRSQIIGKFWWSGKETRGSPEPVQLGHCGHQLHVLVPGAIRTRDPWNIQSWKGLQLLTRWVAALWVTTSTWELSPNLSILLCWNSDLIQQHLLLGLQVSANRAHPESSQFNLSMALLHRGSQKQDLPFHHSRLRSFPYFQLLRGMGVSRIPWLVSQAQHPGEFVVFVSPQLLLQHRLQEVITTWVQANVGYHPAKKETF